MFTLNFGTSVPCSPPGSRVLGKLVVRPASWSGNYLLLRNTKALYHVHKSLPLAAILRWIQSTPTSPVFLSFILIVSFHLRLAFLSGLFPSGLFVENFTASARVMENIAPTRSPYSMQKVLIWWSRTNAEICFKMLARYLATCNITW